MAVVVQVHHRKLIGVQCIHHQYVDDAVAVELESQDHRHKKIVAQGIYRQYLDDTVAECVDVQDHHHRLNGRQCIHLQYVDDAVAVELESHGTFPTIRPSDLGGQWLDAVEEEVESLEVD